MAGEAASVGLALLEAALNRYLALDPAALPRLAPLTGRVIALEVRGIDLRLFLLPGGDGIQVLGRYEGTPDAVLRGAPGAFARLGLTPGGTDLLFAGEVTIEGDTELGQRFKAVLDDLEIDWEEQLSQLVGDLAAHQLARGARWLRDWGRASARSLQQDVGEYLQEEARIVPSAFEVEELMDEIDVLRADGDRLAARIERLEAALGARASEPGGST